MYTYNYKLNISKLCVEVMKNYFKINNGLTTTLLFHLVSENKKFVLLLQFSMSFLLLIVPITS